MAQEYEYDIEDLMAISEAYNKHLVAQEEAIVALRAQDLNEEEFEAAEQLIKEQEIELTPEQEELVDDFNDAMLNISAMSNKEIKALYKELKDKYHTNDESKRLFKAYKKNFKKMIKSDKKRTPAILLNKAKYASLAAVTYGLFLGIEAGGVGLTFPKPRPSLSTIDYIQIVARGNIQEFMDFIPESKIVAGACAIGIGLWAGGKALVKLDDVKTMRRLMVHAMSENMTEKEANAMAYMFTSTKEKSSPWGKSSIYSVKDAMNTTPLVDYGKSLDTLTREKYEREQKAKKLIEENAEKNDGMTEKTSKVVALEATQEELKGPVFVSRKSYKEDERER